MAKRTIIFRADGGPTIGMGHFTRTLALAEMLNEHFLCTYATQKPTDYQINEIEKVCHQRIDLPDNETHFDDFLNLLKGDEIIVLDNYYFSTDYQRAIRAKGCKLVCIDDLQDKHYVADVVINHAEGIMENSFSKEPYTKLCLGFQYALLRKEFLLETPAFNKKKYSCLLMIGGADPLNITVNILSLIEPQNQHLPTVVVVGSSFQNEEQLREIPNAVIYKSISSLKALQLMVDSKFGILPASTVAIEACAARLPYICGYFIDNQKLIYNGIKKNKLAVCIDNLLKIDRYKLSNSINEINKWEIVNNITNRQKTLMDKKSKERFIIIFNQL